MKKSLLSITTALLLASTGLIFTSCEDVEEARVLSGEWTGDMGMYYSDGYREYDASYTDIRFIPYNDYSSNGWGEEIDYFGYGFCPIRYQSFRFEWRIDFGVIYLHYPYNQNLDVAIRDYRLGHTYFKGWIGDTRFTLRKLVDYYDWNLYNSGTGYGYEYYDQWGGHYYAPTRADVDSTSVTTDNVSPENFTFGRRFNDIAVN